MVGSPGADRRNGRLPLPDGRVSCPAVDDGQFSDDGPAVHVWLHQGLIAGATHFPGGADRAKLMGMGRAGFGGATASSTDRHRLCP